VDLRREILLPLVQELLNTVFSQKVCAQPYSVIDTLRRNCLRDRHQPDLIGPPGNHPGIFYVFTYPGIAFSNSISFAVSGNCVIEGGIMLNLIAPERLLKTDISLTGGSIGKAEILTSDINNTMLIGKDIKFEVITCNTTMQITYGDGCEYTESVAEGTVTIVPGSDS